MNNNRYIFCIVWLFAVNVLQAQDVPNYRIIPSQAYSGAVSEYFDSVEYIPLETTKESTFGEARNIIVTDSSIVVYDYDARTCLFFTSDGKFIRKIVEGAYAYSRIYFDQPKKQVVLITDDYATDRQYISYYSETGIIVDKFQMRVVSTSGIKLEIVPIGSGYFASGTNFHLWPDKQPVDSSFELIKIYRGQTLHKSLIPYNQQFHLAASILVGFIEASGFVENKAFHIGTPLEHEIYKITKDTAVKICKLVFPLDYSFTQEVIKSQDRKALEEMNRAISTDMQKVLFVNNILFRNNILFFKVNTKALRSSSRPEAGAKRNFIYNIKTGQLVSMERIRPDTKSYFLPVTGTIFEFTYFNGSFYTQIASSKMFTEKKKGKSRNPQYPPVLQEYFKTQNRKSNPVIIKMRLKER